MFRIFFNRLTLSDNIKSLLRGMGSVFSLYVPTNKFSDYSVSNRLDDRLKELHKEHPSLYRKYSYKNPGTIADCWEDTGKLLSWSMGSYENGKTDHLGKNSNEK